MRSLGLDPEAAEFGSISVRYIRLPKATFVRVVPTTAGLSQVSELRAMLEHNLRLHATCTVGDWLEVGVILFMFVTRLLHTIEYSLECAFSTQYSTVQTAGIVKYGAPA
jgi:Ubiquitin fusion degradation protein UFD1